MRERINASYRIQADNERGYSLLVTARMPRADTHLSYLRGLPLSDTHLSYLRGGHVRIPLLYLRGLPRADTHLLYLLGLPRADRGRVFERVFLQV